MPLSLPSTGLQTRTTSGFLHRRWRWKLGSLCLHSKHFIHSIPQATNLFLKGSQADSCQGRKSPKHPVHAEYSERPWNEPIVPEELSGDRKADGVYRKEWEVKQAESSNNFY